MRRSGVCVAPDECRFQALDRRRVAGRCCRRLGARRLPQAGEMLFRPRQCRAGVLYVASGITQMDMRLAKPGTVIDREQSFRLGSSLGPLAVRNIGRMLDRRQI